jgi:hypothetical protein
LNQLLAKAILVRMVGLDGGDSPDGAETLDPTAMAGPRAAVDAGALLQRARVRLAAVEDALHAAQIRRDALLDTVTRAETRLAQADQQVAATREGAAAYLDTALERGQEIIEQAHTTAQQIIADAERKAASILAGDAGPRAAGPAADGIRRAG